MSSAKTPRELADWLVAAHPVFAGARDSYKVDAIQKVIEEAVATERERCAGIMESYCDTPEKCKAEELPTCEYIRMAQKIRGT